MSAPNSSAPGSSTPGGELQQISPGAWPTANGGQRENSTSSAAIQPLGPEAAPSSDEEQRTKEKRATNNLGQK